MHLLGNIIRSRLIHIWHFDEYLVHVELINYSICVHGIKEYVTQCNSVVH